MTQRIANYPRISTLQIGASRGPTNPVPPASTPRRAIMMYAMARYNAFSWLTRDELAEQAPDETASCSAGEYRTVLRENLKEMRPVYRAGDKDTPE